MNDEWETPDDLWNALNDEFHFKYDLAASPDNTKRPFYYSKERDSLNASWHTIDGYCWLNPPYSRGLIDKFMWKVAEEAAQGAQIVTLTRLDSTVWFRDHVMGMAREIRLCARRLKFKGADSSYPFPCCISVFDQPMSAERIKFTVYDW